MIELNRAVAVGMAFGATAGLELVDALTKEPTLEGYHLLYAVRADLLAKVGRLNDVCVDLERAAGLTDNEKERAMLLARASALPR